ncbi:DEAD/DEAH box helicase [Massilia sp. DWR3-1-1]|uniref:DEAD/DEAH box helicase n=1 Tax=Massilia sp. DWR3-1-1 TaxID=2804559 RepID=UPI003CF87776
MTASSVQQQFAAFSDTQKLIAALLALAGEPMGKSRITLHLAEIGVVIPATTLESDLALLKAMTLATEVTGRGFSLSAPAVWPALRVALDAGMVEPLRHSYQKIMPLRVNWEGNVVLRSYRQGVAMLRMALLLGDDASVVTPLLDACLACHEAGYSHPLIDIAGSPFEAELVDRIHPAVRDDVVAVLLNHCQHAPAGARAIGAYAEALAARPGARMPLRVALTAHLILCGRLDDAGALLAELDASYGHMFDGAIALLRGDDALALARFDEGLKLRRRETGKRKAIFSGFAGHLYVLGLLKSGEPRHLKQAETYLEIATKGAHSADTAVYQQLSMLRQIRAGTVDPEVLPTRAWETQMQPVLFRALLHWWLGSSALAGRKALLEQACEDASGAGFDLIAAQLGAVLGQLGALGHEQQAIALRQRQRYADMTIWFEREEAWQRQLNALINLQPAVNVETVRESRLVWLIGYAPDWGINSIEPREQKRDAQGGWSRGRAMSLKRLADDAGQIDFLTSQDLAVVATIEAFKYYSQSGSRYELDTDKAVAALIGHPLLFWIDAPGSRVELLPGEPELLVKASAGQVTITMRPSTVGADDVCISRETSSRLRVVRLNAEHRRVGAIIGTGLVVPLAAEKQVLKAISAISSIVTVQSDIGGSDGDIDQVAADPRLHVHLLPYQQGLRMQLLVRPLPGAGAYYPPGSGAESVIAELNGARVEARRDLNAEREAERQLIGACHSLEYAEDEHGEWLLGQPVPCLELLAELQEVDPAKVLVAWPEGESFKVSKKVESKSMRLSIKRDTDWFAANGDVQIDEDRIVDLRALLDMLRSSHGRFVELGDNQFVALSTELHRRLMELAAYGELTADGVRVHPLASFALEELAHDAGGVKADKMWKEHLKRLAATTVFTPALPSTLQAELRDYQLDGYQWLARLAHWGVGACLADDMGLGKTVQALALLLQRAPGGPALVVAPTSVCMNWMAEAEKFAPTLRIKLFGAGDRAALLDGVAPFDLVVVSYGLLQLAAAQFAQVRWHTVVLDEAQAIKNNATKRSQAVMALQADFKMVATGTPLENHLGELWNLFRFINPGLLGSAEQFNLRFAGPIEKAQDKRAEQGARTRLRRLIQPFILRRTKAQVLTELPPRTEIVLPVDLTAPETALYESLRRDALARLAALEQPQHQKSIEILAEMMKLRRACCNPNLVAPELQLESSKLGVFARLVDDLLENRHKVLVFSQFVDHLSLIRRHLDARGIAYQYLDGATPMAERKKRVDAFQAGIGDLFLISLKAGGVGINLTAADYVIHMDPWWNPAVEDQASDRAHRMGQLRPVTIYRLVARHTIEEGIVDLHKHKRDLADSLLEGADLAARMSPTDMLRMLEEGLAK